MYRDPKKFSTWNARSATANFWRNANSSSKSQLTRPPQQKIILNGMNILILLQRKKDAKRLHTIRIQKRNGVHENDLTSMYIWSVLQYGCGVWHTSLPNLSLTFSKVLSYHLPSAVLPLDLTGFLTLEDNRQHLCDYVFFLTILNRAQIRNTNGGGSIGRLVRNCRTDRFKNSYSSYAEWV